MKREFLQNFKVGEQALPKEIIDAIMEENGRDIESAKKPFADYESLKEQLKAAKDGLAAFKDVDVDKLQGKITELTGQLADKDKQWQEKLDGMALVSCCRNWWSGISPAVRNRKITRKNMSSTTVST